MGIRPCRRALRPALPRIGPDPRHCRLPAVGGVRDENRGHFGGYAGGLTTGSWAALYNSAGTRVAQTADLSTAGAEPAEVHNAGGATVSVPLTAAYSAAAGLYYVAWRFQYNTSTGDGPMMLVAESSFGSPPNVFGLTTVRRFGSYATGAASAPASLTLSSMENGSNRFWAALA